MKSGYIRFMFYVHAHVRLYEVEQKSEQLLLKSPQCTRNGRRTVSCVSVCNRALNTLCLTLRALVGVCIVPFVRRQMVAAFPSVIDQLSCFDVCQSEGRSV